MSTCVTPSQPDHLPAKLLPEPGKHAHRYDIHVPSRCHSPDTGATLTEQQQSQLFDDFYEDVYVEMADKYGPVEELHVCDNLGEHLIGNVYVRFRSEDDADKAVADLSNRWFAGKPCCTLRCERSQ